MIPKNDIRLALEVWGPSKIEIDSKSIELWGNVEPESIIKMYRKLRKGSTFEGSKTLERSHHKSPFQ